MRGPLGGGLSRPFLQVPGRDGPGPSWRGEPFGASFCFLSCESLTTYWVPCPCWGGKGTPTRRANQRWAGLDAGGRAGTHMPRLTPKLSAVCRKEGSEVAVCPALRMAFLGGSS